MRITTEKLLSISNLWLFIINKKRFEKFKGEPDYQCDCRITIVDIKNRVFVFKTNSIHQLKIWLDLNNLKITDFGFGEWTQGKDMTFGERGCFLIKKNNFSLDLIKKLCYNIDKTK